MNYRLSVSILVHQNDKISVVSSRKWGGFSLPGGKVDPGESFDQVVRREFLEETGCEVTRRVPLQILEAVHYEDGSDPGCECACSSSRRQAAPRKTSATTPPYWSP